MLTCNRIVAVLVLLVLAAAALPGCYELTYIPELRDVGSEVAIDSGNTDVLVADALDASDGGSDAADGSLLIDVVEVEVAIDSGNTDVLVADALEVTSPVDVTDVSPLDRAEAMTDSDVLAPDASDGGSDAADARDVGVPDVRVCPAGQTSCGGRCVNTISDPVNCGRCGGTCPAGIVCAASVCPDALILTPVSYGFLGVDSARYCTTWGGCRGSDTAESYLPMTYIQTGVARLPSGLFSIVRGWVRFVGIPSTGVTAARIAFSPPYGTWANAVPQVLNACAFLPAGEAILATDYSLMHWGNDSLGSTDNASFAGSASASLALNGGGITRLMDVASRGFVGFRMGSDLSNVAPTTASGMNIVAFGDGRGAPPNIRLLITYRP